MPAPPAHSRLAASLTNGVLKRHPWSYAYLPYAVPAELAAKLARGFDASGLTRAGRETGTKTYKFGHAELTGYRTRALDSAWRWLVDVVRSTDYRQRIQRLTQVDLQTAEIAMDLWEYRPDDWLAPHVDKADKVVTQIVYLTEHWRESDAGRLLVLNSDDPADLHRALPPVCGSSAILVRSESSWHSVEKLAPTGATRRSLTITFRRPGGTR